MGGNKVKILKKIKYTKINNELCEYIINEMEYYKKESNLVIDFLVQKSYVIIYERDFNKLELENQKRKLEKQALNILMGLAGRRLI